MKISIDGVEFTQEDFSQKLIEKGEYPATILEVKNGKTEKKGTPFISVKARIKVGKQFQTLTQNFYTSPGALKISKRQLDEFHFAAFGTAEDADYSKMVGANIPVYVKIREDAEYGDKNEFGAALTAEQKRAFRAEKLGTGIVTRPQQAVVTISKQEDDEIPF